MKIKTTHSFSPHEALPHFLKDKPCNKQWPYHMQLFWLKLKKNCITWKYGYKARVWKQRDQHDIRMLKVIKVVTRAAANLFPLQWTVRKDCQGQTVCLEQAACSLWPWMCLFGFQWWARSIAGQKYKSPCGAFGKPDRTWVVGGGCFFKYWALCF